MKTNETPSTESASNQNNPCFGNDSTVAALNVVAGDERSLLLPYAQFLYSERTPNPALEHEPDAPPERLLIRFAVAEIIVTGSGLSTLEQALQKHELKFVKLSDPRCAATFRSRIAVISVAFLKEVA